MHRTTENIIRLVRDRYSFQYPDLKEEFPTLPANFYQDMVIVFQNPDRFEAKNFQHYSLELILSYLEITHSFYINKRLDEIELAIENLRRSGDVRVHEWYPFMKEFMKNFSEEMVEHIEEEERCLIPYIHVLLNAQKTKVLTYTSKEKLCLMSFMLEHDDQVEEDLHKLIISLESQSDKFQDSFSFRMMLNHLKTFELDLRIHARMEEEVLIPRAVMLEKEVLNDERILIRT